MKCIRRVSLFVRIAWRKWENESCGIPKEYRCEVRVPASLAWELAKGIWK